MELPPIKQTKLPPINHSPSVSTIIRKKFMNPTSELLSDKHRDNIDSRILSKDRLVTETDDSQNFDERKSIKVIKLPSNGLRSNHTESVKKFKPVLDPKFLEPQLNNLEIERLKELKKMHGRKMFLSEVNDNFQRDLEKDLTIKNPLQDDVEVKEIPLFDKSTKRKMEEKRKPSKDNTKILRESSLPPIDGKFSPNFSVKILDSISSKKPSRTPSTTHLQNNLLSPHTKDVIPSIGANTTVSKDSLKLAVLKNKWNPPEKKDNIFSPHYNLKSHKDPVRIEIPVL